MRTKQEIYNELKRLIVADYENDNRTVADEATSNRYRHLSIKLKERIDTLEWVLEVKE